MKVIVTIHLDDNDNEYNNLYDNSNKDKIINNYNNDSSNGSNKRID